MFLNHHSSRSYLSTEGGDNAGRVVKALCYDYKPEGRGFENRGGKLIFSMYLILPAALGPGVYSASNRNEYQKEKNNVSGNRALPVRRVENLTAICEPIF
jgi:hypothetical protein